MRVLENIYHNTPIYHPHTVLDSHPDEGNHVNYIYTVKASAPTLPVNIPMGNFVLFLNHSREIKQCAGIPCSQYKVLYGILTSLTHLPIGHGAVQRIPNGLSSKRHTQVFFFGENRYLIYTFKFQRNKSSIYCKNLPSPFPD